ncbi:MAG TPA: hypothetical protein VL049_13035 [Candidatus Dormibacteraeota bacterium]|nr:hypothetical protein [Candidatus Dormibacteraeota bacterium]
MGALLAIPPSALLISVCAVLLAPPLPAGDGGVPGWTAVAMWEGLGRAWPINIAVALLPMAGVLPAPGSEWWTALMMLVAVLFFTWRRNRTEPDAAAGTGLLLRSIGDGPTRLWTIFLLVLATVIGIAYVAIGTQTRQIAQNDGAYYYGIARHMVLTGRFEEPLVWHFLHPPDTLVHPPFDYWGCLTSLLLVPSLFLFGTKPETAFVTMSVVSAAGLIAFWYLICVALPLRYWMSQLVALVLFAFSPMMLEYRFQPESIAVSQLATILALVAYARRKLLLAILFAFGILLSRGDGLILFGLICAAALVAAVRDIAADPRRPWKLLLAIALCVGTYIGWSWMSFGTLTPPAPRILPFLADYWQVFDFGPVYQPSWSDTLRWFDWEYLVGRAEILRLWYPLLWFTPAPSAWFVLVAIPALTLFRRRPQVEVLIWLLGVVGFLTLVWVSGPGFYIGRTPAPFTPLVILAGALGVDAVLARLESWSVGHRSARARSLLLTVGLFCLCQFFFARLPALAVTGTAAQTRLRTSVSQLDPILRGEPAASNRPWYLIAYTSSPAVSIPYNGEAAIETVLRRYGVRWLVIFGRPTQSSGVLRELAIGAKSSIGRLRLERVPAPAPLTVLRIVTPVEAE